MLLPCFKTINSVIPWILSGSVLYIAPLGTVEAAIPIIIKKIITIPIEIPHNHIILNNRHCISHLIIINLIK